MADSLLQTALEEAYASAPINRIPLDALEIDHPAFTRPIRVIRWPAVGPEPTVFQVRHEDDAPINPGAIVEYVGLPFDLILPESSSEAEGTFQLRLAVYAGVDDYLRDAALSRGIITAIYRQYIKGMELDGPAEVWPDIEIQSPRREGGDIVANGAILRWMNKSYREIYTPGRFPGLVMGR